MRALSRSDVRGEADRARAILLTLQGWSSFQVAAAFGVTPEAVRHWQGWFAERGVDALAPGPSPAKEERALAVASALLRQPVEGRTNWTLPRLRAQGKHLCPVGTRAAPRIAMLREHAVRSPALNDQGHATA